MCPVKIDIPTILVHLRGRIVRRSAPGAEGRTMRAAATAMSGQRRFRLAWRLGRPVARLLAGHPTLALVLPGPLRAWASVRELPAPPDQGFREWWRQHEREQAERR